MASYWKSLPKKYCEYCSCWITDNKASVEFHERGKKHQEKKEKKIAQIRKKSQAQFTSDKDTAEFLKQMEIDAIEKYKKDLLSQGIKLVGKYTDTKSSEDLAKSVLPLPIDDPRPRGSSRRAPRMAVIEPRILPRKSAWNEKLSPEGYLYYWNSENGKTQWEKPLGYVSKSDMEPQKVEIKPSEIQNIPLPDEQSTSSEEKPIMSKTNESKSRSIEKSDDSDAPPAKTQRIDPYGAWTVVTNNNKQSHLPEKPKAPELLYKPITSIPKTELQQEVEPEVRNFAEKVIKSIDDGDSSAPAVFKKKTSKQRSIRKRT